MIRAVDRKYCNNDCVQIMTDRGICNLVIDDNEILYLRNGNKVLVDKFSSEHADKKLFPVVGENSGYDSFYQLYDYNKLYLSFRGGVGGYTFHKLYFFKGTERALFVSDSLKLDDASKIEEKVVLNREVIEKVFNSDNYDSMYVMNRNGFIHFAKDSKHGILIDKKLIPSDEELEELDLEERIGDYTIARSLNPAVASHAAYEKAHTKRSIEEIDDLKLFGGAVLDNYSDLLLTIKDGIISLRWFRLYCIGKDKFKFIYSDVPVIVPTVDDVLNYHKDNDIRYTLDPLDEGDDVTEAVNNLDTERDLPEIAIPSEDGDKPKNFGRVFKRNRDIDKK